MIPLVHPYGGTDYQPFDIQSGVNQPIFVDVRIPAHATAGTYVGSIQISATGGRSFTMPLVVNVWDLLLPDMTTVPTIFVLMADYSRSSNQAFGHLWHYHSETNGGVVLKRYENLAHEHRIDTGQKDIYWTAGDRGCGPPTDFTRFDQGMQPYMDGTYFDDGIPSSNLRLDLFTGARDWPLGQAACSDNEWKQVAQAWYDHLTSKPLPGGGTWWDKTIFYGVDEPGSQGISYAWLHARRRGEQPGPRGAARGGVPWYTDEGIMNEIRSDVATAIMALP